MAIGVKIMQIDPQNNATFKKVVLFVALANLAYFFVEFVVALNIHSVSLFADSIDFLEDSSVNFLILVALGWTLAKKARLGMFLAALILVPAVSTVWMTYEKIINPTLPNAYAISIVGLGALLVNLTCAYKLAKFKNYSGSLSKAAFLSARNDALANIALIIVGIITLFTSSPWPDIIVGIAIALINADAAVEVFQASRKELNDARG